MKSIVGPEMKDNGNYMVFNLPSTIQPETATLAQNMQELGTFALFVSDMIIEKGLLKTSKEQISPQVGSSPDRLDHRKLHPSSG